MHIIEAVKAVNPFLEKIPINMHEEYLDDYVSTATRLLWSDSQQTTNLLFSYKLIVYYARK